MTHEEKALYLSQKYGAPKNKNREIAIYQSTIEMADWKDQQFKEYLEKNRTNYPDFMNGTDAYAFGMKEGYVKAFDRIIKELFGKD